MNENKSEKQTQVTVTGSKKGEAFHHAGPKRCRADDGRNSNEHRVENSQQPAAKDGLQFRAESPQVKHIQEKPNTRNMPEDVGSPLPPLRPEDNFSQGRH